MRLSCVHRANWGAGGGTGRAFSFSLTSDSVQTSDLDMSFFFLAFDVFMLTLVRSKCDTPTHN